MNSNLIRISLALVIAYLTSCSSIPYVKELDMPIFDSPFVKELINPGKFTEPTHDLLEQRALLDDFYDNPAELVSVLRSDLRENTSPQLLLALVEVCSNAAEHLAEREPMKAVAYHLTAAEAALPAALNGSDDEMRGNLREMYNFSCGRVAQILYKNDHHWGEVINLKGPDRVYRLRCITSGEGFISPTYFDEFWAAKNLEFKKIKNLSRNIRQGFGEMMVGHREYSQERLVKEPLLSRMGMSLPVSVIIEPVGDKGLMEMAFHDVMVEDTAKLMGKPVVLAADFTAPLAMLYNYKPKGNIGKQGLLHPQKYAEQMGLVQFEPFRNKEIPVVFVHGLASSPATWMTAVNKLREDPNIRKRFQLLAFYYPTGFPIAYNSDGLRKHLQKFQDFYDHKNINPNMDNILIIGHSMGGVLSNAQIRNSGKTLSKAIFTVPFEQVRGLNAKQKSVLKERLIYKASSDITRAIFVAAPHRGSGFAVNPIGYLMKKMIKLPVGVFAAGEILLTDDLSEDLTSFGKRLVTRGASSINSLEPNNPILSGLLEQPVREGVQYHSIIGQTDLTLAIEEGSDRVVPYSSAHLAGAQSELIVNAKHTRLTGHQVEIEEIRRILYLHAGLEYTPLPLVEMKAVKMPRSKGAKSLFLAPGKGR